MAKRILIVEDDPAIGPMIAQILALDGVESEIVAEGRRALDVLGAGSFDMVILDVMLPGLDGISILKAIREKPATSSLPVLMLTAKVDDETTWAGWRAGCDYYLPKPFDPEVLVATVKGIEKARTSSPG